MSADQTARLTAALADRYRIERELGAGGMATVYLAHDLKHDRDVAIKVLHPDLGAALGGDRFLSEIRTTARLQHPHILPLLDSGDADGLLYYAMPVVTGETLRARLERERQLPVPEAVRISREVAGALDYAHRQGIIHRDIKPENILLHDGQALVADFGIALAVQSAGGQRMTQTGLSLGTPQYMSPEQAMGERAIDTRTDVYALGAVAYEMLAGDPPFTGSTVQAIVAKVLTDRPAPIRTTRDTVPEHVEGAVMTALAKLPADRFESAKAFADALVNPAFGPGAANGTRAVGVAAPGRWRMAAVALGLVALVASGDAVSGRIRARSTPRDIGLPPASPMRMEDVHRNFAAAHDGSFIIYEAKFGESSQLWYRSLTGPEVHVIAGTDGANGTPRIAPDDKRVAFMSGGEIKVIGVAGGPVSSVARAGDPHGGGWLESGSIFFSNDDGRTLHWIDPEAGPGRTAVIGYCVMPQPLGDDRILCAGGAQKHASVRSLARPNERRFVHRSSQVGGSGPPLLVGSDFRLVDGKYLVYMSIDGTLSATRFENLDSLTVGKSVSLMPMTRRSPYSGEGQFDLTRSGTLVYLPGVNAEVGRLVRRAPDGPAVPLPVVPAAYLRFTPSPDGQRLAAVVEGIQQQELWLYDLRTATHETIDQGLYLGGASWSPDGRHLAYRKVEFDHPDHGTLYLRQVDSPEPPRILAESEGALGVQPSSYLAENFLLVGSLRNGGTVTIMDPTVTPPKVEKLPLASNFISMSPDRNWIVYQNDGATGIQVQPWPSLDRRYQVDAQGREPLWHSLTEFVYFSYFGHDGSVSQTFNRVTIDPISGTPVGKPQVLFVDPRFMDTPGWSHAMMPGGDVLYLQAQAENLGYYVRVVPGWVTQMKRAVDEANK